MSGSVNTPLVIHRDLVLSRSFETNIQFQQENPPAGNRKRRTARGITCPSITCLANLSRGYHILTWPGGTPSSPGCRGAPLARTGIPPSQYWGTPQKGTWDQWKYCGMEMGNPLPPVEWTDKQTENITSRRTSHAGSNEQINRSTILKSLVFRTTNLLSLVFRITYFPWYVSPS